MEFLPLFCFSVTSAPEELLINKLLLKFYFSGTFKLKIIPLNPALLSQSVSFCRGNTAASGLYGFTAAVSVTRK